MRTNKQNRDRPLPNPKQRGVSDWYPYYAGYREAFVEAALSSFIGSQGPVVDPWSGSGTTSVVAARLGLSSIGVDLNPALTVVAKGRLQHRLMGDELEFLLNHLIAFARDLEYEQGADLLETWLVPSAAHRFRGWRAAILGLAAGSSMPFADAPADSPIDTVDALSVETCFLLSALFLTLRNFLTPFGSTNPTWIREPTSWRNRLCPKQRAIEKSFAVNLCALNDKLPARNGTPPIGVQARFVTGCATALDFGDNAFGAALTSPPYATRIDYVKGTYPELAILGYGQARVSVLRRDSMGGPIVRDVPRSDEPSVSPYANMLIKKVAYHESKGSKSYYGPWIQIYLTRLQAGLAELDRVVRTGGRIGIVVQDSFYKEKRIDLQRVVTEVMEHMERSLISRVDFPASTVMSRMNPRARAHRKDRSHRESLLVFG